MLRPYIKFCALLFDAIEYKCEYINSVMGGPRGGGGQGVQSLTLVKSKMVIGFLRHKGRGTHEKQ